ncbi:MAG TPA: TraR/DksA family transcriptional regulator [Pseudoduganella sp.]
MVPEEINRWTAVLRQRRELLVGRDPAEVAAIDAALERLRAGTFGQCQRCGAAISAGRMQAQPSAATCLACQELAEGQRSFISLPTA